MPRNVEIQITEGESGGRIAVLRVQGRLDANTAPQLMQRCNQIQANGQNLVLNLSGVSFLGSTGVGTMLALVEQFQEQGGVVHFAALSEPARAVIDLLDLSDYLSIHATEQDALAVLNV